MEIERDVLGRAPAQVWGYLRTAPGTLIYLFTLQVTQLTLDTVDDHLGQRLLISESTNLFNMARVPVQVLIGSAFWIDSSTLVSCGALAALLAVLVPLERWLGTGRWLVALATGHIGATLLTLVVTTCLLRHGLLSPAVAHAADVGVSYALLAGFGLLVHRLPRRRYRLVVAVLATVVLAVVLVKDQEIADLGHLLGFLIGFGLFPLVPRGDRAAAVAAPAPAATPAAVPLPRTAGVPSPAGAPSPAAVRRSAARQLAGPALTVANGQIHLTASEKS
jgi:hypothetical protein